MTRLPLWQPLALSLFVPALFLSSCSESQGGPKAVQRLLSDSERYVSSGGGEEIGGWIEEKVSPGDLSNVLSEICGEVSGSVLSQEIERIGLLANAFMHRGMSEYDFILSLDLIVSGIMGEADKGTDASTSLKLRSVLMVLFDRIALKEKDSTYVLVSYTRRVMELMSKDDENSRFVGQVQAAIQDLDHIGKDL